MWELFLDIDGLLWGAFLQHTSAFGSGEISLWF